MSQKVSRKTAVSEEVEKRNSPVKEMKKKMAANAEKEKQAAEKATEKQTEKPVEKQAEKEKSTDSKSDKHEKNDKPEKSADKQTKEEQKKPEPQPEKTKEASKDDKDKNGKPEKSDAKKPETSKQNGKQNGRDRVHNGVSDVTLGTNGTDDVLNGTVSADSEDDDVMLVIDDNDQDDLFPELTYEETSDGDCFELPTPESGPSRSLTRRSQVKSTRTPETPRPASDKQTDKDADDPKDKVLKLKEDATVPTDRKLRSSNSPKPQEGKKDSKKDKLESPTKGEGLQKVDEKEEDAAKEKGKDGDVEVEVTLEVPGNEEEEPRKTDTNFSKSRVKVSPYRRSMRIADQTNTSLQANYTGNNTTMEMDISESSVLEEPTLDDSSYLRGLRSIRGRSSYKPLKEITLRHLTTKRTTTTTTTPVTSPAPSTESHSRPTGTVVGRKRKPDVESLELGVEATETAEPAPTKRMRVLDRLAEPFRRVAAAAALPAVARRNAEIVGINTDLPLTAPVASTETFDPESLKPAPTGPPPLVPSTEPVAVPLVHDEKDNKRCVIM
ncbi:muscle M-line assembly protein unc-89 isoform X1 [Spodoptera frugiperda]|uniref:Muscle M-line assembly protein unc-89 isoform X1 n=1 Tax=Spodoptera frugiperda TaxID=7108 RepID=A0A9R0D6T7_SPOFR|nr:muscle M-line assembly protein unc-89 isoform X1 [Spodoptera frugiperda]